MQVRELQVVCGGLVYFTGFRRPLLSALNAVWRFMEELKTVPPVVRLPPPRECARGAGPVLVSCAPRPALFYLAVGRDGHL